LKIFNENAKKNYEIEKECIIGRDKKCSIRLDQKSISKTHCEIQYNGIGYFIKDNKSKFGTFFSIDDNGLYPEEGSEILLNDVLYEFSIDEYNSISFTPKNIEYKAPFKISIIKNHKKYITSSKNGIELVLKNDEKIKYVAISIEQNGKLHLKPLIDNM